jgi:hypothetical protein
MTVIVNNPVAGNLAANYGMFQDNNTQTNVGIGEDPPEANVMTFDTTDFANGISIVSNSRITIATGGIYNIQFSSQFSRAGGVPGFSTIEIWLAKNGTTVPETNTEVNVPQSGGKAVAAWNFLVESNSGDYYELYWYSSDAAVEMWSRDVATNPARPEIPSVILTVSQVA